MIRARWFSFSLIMVWITDISSFMPAPEFSKHVFVQPRILNSRQKREVSILEENQVELNHPEQLNVAIEIDGEEQVLDLYLNRDLIPNNYFEKQQSNGKYIIRRPSVEDMDLFYYNGKIRNNPDSWAAVSTCNGISGVIYDGKTTYYIERPCPHNQTCTVDDIHILYSGEHLNSNFTCGFHDPVQNHIEEITQFAKGVKTRVKRSSDTLHGPYNSNRNSRYVELLLVIDNALYMNFNEDIPLIHQRCKEIANIINSLYMPLNIYVALVGVIIWSKYDEINLETSGDKTLTNFLHYRKETLVKEHPNDNAQLLTRTPFEGGVVGKALKGPICTYEFSGGVNMYHSNVVGLVATTVAHEMGHNLGMEHDSADCYCPSERCIMSPSASSSTPTDWSKCSIEFLALSFEHGMDYCLRNKPERLFESPVCGNSFVEPGEECDCGLKERCDNPCCNATTCMLYPNATCATGECCDLQTCKPRTAGTECRAAGYECDLPEYCTGNSEYCPPDVFKIDGEPCSLGEAYCYQGNCRSRSDQCQLLWGRSGNSSDTRCYELNTKGTRHGNCGYNRVNQTFMKCEDEDIYCGMLQCKHYNERLEYGMESVSILSHSFINSGGHIIPCRTAIVDLGLNEVDPGLAPDGSKCGENKMCVNQKCMSVASLRSSLVPGACPYNCNNHGICNSRGHCHCDVGYAPPFCTSPGPGGSEDSGPATDPDAGIGVLKILYYMLLSIFSVSTVFFAVYMYYMKRNPSYFWKKTRRPSYVSSRSSCCLNDLGLSFRHGEKTKQFSSVRKNDFTNRPVTVTSPIHSLLASDESKTPMMTQSNAASDFKSSLIGNFKGFSITPLSTAAPCASVAPSRVAPSLPHTAPEVSTRPTRCAPKIPVSGTSSNIANASSLVEPPPSYNSIFRPNISSPVLDNTTSTAVKELIKKDAPVRPAPPAPVHSRLERPLSTPVAIISDAKPDIVPAEKSTNSTLNRFASFMSRREPAPLKANKIDRGILRNLEISDPIPLSNVNIPSNPLPLGKEEEKAVVMRAHSLRHPSNSNKRPVIPSFGSVRLPPNRRPTSIPTCSRPTSPPPRPPPLPSIDSVPGYQNPGSSSSSYDDCLNVRSPPNDPEENIYAVIEEAPQEDSIGTGTGAGVEQSGGLLDEIVSEIKARNSTLCGENPEIRNDDDTVSSITDISSVSKGKDQYENTGWLTGKDAGRDTSPHKSNSSSSSTTSSGYLRPLPVGSVNPEIVEKIDNKLKVPEKSAPTYKPFSSSVKRNIGPITSLRNTNMSKNGSFKKSNSSTDEKPISKSLNQTRSQLSSQKNEQKSTSGNAKSISKSGNAANSGPAISKQPSASFRSFGKYPVPAPKPNLMKSTKNTVTEGSVKADEQSKSSVAYLQQKFESTKPNDDLK